MKFGLLYDFRNPPHAGVDFGTLYQETFEQIKAVEQLGFDSVWVTEHHFIGDGYLPSCLPATAAIAAITKRVQIGTSVLLLPLHNALRIAEDAAVVEVISNGRLILGLGLGYKLDEFEGFGISRRHRPGLMDEGIEVIHKAWTEASFDYHGKHYQLKNIRMTPKPIQKPRPAIWLAARAEQPLRRAARLAEGVIAVGEPSLISMYRGFARQAGKDRSQSQVGVLRSAVISDDPERTWAELREWVGWRGDLYRTWYGEAGDLEVDRARLAAAPVPEERLMRSLIKTPEALIQELREMEAMGIDHAIYFATFPGYPPLKMLPTWQAFAEKVMPAFWAAAPTAAPST